MVAASLIGGREGVDVGELGPCDREHLGRGVQLHGARAERDHGPVEGDVLVGQPAQVAQHLGLGVVAVERRVGEEVRGAPQRTRNGVFDREVEVVDRVLHVEGGPDGLDDLACGGLVERDAERVVVDAAQVEARLARSCRDLVASARHADGDRVEERVVRDLDVAAPQPGGQDRREPVHASRDAAEAVGAVVGRVQTGDHGQQHLCGADVARGLLASDVLLARLQRQPVGGAAVGVDRHADEPTGQRALVGVLRGDERRMRSAVHQRHAEALRGADDDVGTHLARRAQQHEGEQVGGDRHQRARFVGQRDERFDVGHPAARTRILQQHTEHATGRRGPSRSTSTTTSMPSGSARVSITAIVCGWQSGSMTKTLPALSFSR